MNSRFEINLALYSTVSSLFVPPLEHLNLFLLLPLDYPFLFIPHDPPSPHPHPLYPTPTSLSAAFWEQNIQWLVCCVASLARFSTQKPHVFYSISLSFHIFTLFSIHRVSYKVLALFQLKIRRCFYHGRTIHYACTYVYVWVVYW